MARGKRKSVISADIFVFNGKATKEPRTFC